MRGLTMRSVDPAIDHEFLLELYGSTRADEFAAIGSARDQLAVLLRLQYRAQEADYRCRFPDSDHCVIEVAGVRCGRVWVDRGPSEIRILDIAVAPERRGQGLGSELVARLQAEATTDRVPLRLSVAHLNERAFKLYRRLGFVVVGDHATHRLMEWHPSEAAG